MKIAFVMDPMRTVKTEKDTSWILMCAAAELGFQVFHVDPSHLHLQGDQLFAEVTEIEVESAAQWRQDSLRTLAMAEMDFVFIRKDPPFDRSYFYTTLLLDFLPSTTKVINRPQSLRDWNEKLAALLFQDLCPPTLISQSAQSIREFAEKYEEVILKPLDGFGGRGITRLKSSQRSELESSITALTQSGSHKIVVNPYLKEAEQGDKRVLLVNGHPIGGVLRKAKIPGQLNNLDQGAQAIASELTPRDLEVCDRLKPHLTKMGLYFVGIDLLGPYLTEINVTSPTGLQELIRFSGRDHHIEMLQSLIDNDKTR